MQIESLSRTRRRDWLALYRSAGVLGALWLGAPVAHAQPDTQGGGALLQLQMSDELTPTAKPAPAPAAKPAEPAAAAAPAAAAGAAAPAGNKIRVPYLSDAERQRMKDELRAEVMETARKENWAQPSAVPDWVRRMRFSGDIVARAERDLYDGSNSNQFFDFNTINDGAPVNVQPPATGQPITIPTINTTQNRTRPVLQARLGMSADIAKGITATLRMATGLANNPTSESQTSGSDFNRINFLLDRAFIRFQLTQGFTLNAGRQPNPFLGYSEMLWDRDLSFDGLGFNARHDYGVLSFAFNGGVFSVENTNPNYPSNSVFKLASKDKWLYGGQLVGTWRVNERLTTQAALAYYNFTNLQGRLSSPCFAPNNAVACDTDTTRPLFVQKGNTMFQLRDLQLVNAGDPQFQYFGLASPFRIAHVEYSADWRVNGPIHLAVDAEYARNLAFNAAKIDALQPINNLGACTTSSGSGTSSSNCTQSFAGGNKAYNVQFRLGHPQIEKRWQWQGTLGYRHVESDALVASFDDSEFFLGGTNAKGTYIGGTLGIADNTYIRSRYLSATQISSLPLSINVVQFDVGVRF